MAAEKNAYHSHSLSARVCRVIFSLPNGAGKGNVLGVARIAAIQASKRHLRIDSAVPPLVSDQDYGGI